MTEIWQILKVLELPLLQCRLPWPQFAGNIFGHGWMVIYRTMLIHLHIYCNVFMQEKIPLQISDSHVFDTTVIIMFKYNVFGHCWELWANNMPVSRVIVQWKWILKCLSRLEHYTVTRVLCFYSQSQRLSVYNRDCSPMCTHQECQGTEVKRMIFIQIILFGAY